MKYVKKDIENIKYFLSAHHVQKYGHQWEQR